MEKVIEIIGIASFAALFARMSGLMEWIGWYYHIKIIKPFSCELCMGWWLGIIYGLYSYGHNSYGHILSIIIFASLTAVTAFFIVRYAER